MRLTYVLGLACGLALTGGANGQQPQAQPNQLQPTFTYPPALYQRGDVRKALNLNQEQVNRLNAITDKMQIQYKAQYGKINTLNDAERAARMQELNRQYYSNWSKSAGDIFNNDQRLRYQQLYHQYAGFNTFYDPEVQKRLTLTPEQVKNLQNAVDWSNQQLQIIQNANDPTKAGQLYNDYWKQRQERLNNFLTPEQRQVWREITGEPYTFQPYFPPRNEKP